MTSALFRCALSRMTSIDLRSFSEEIEDEHNGPVCLRDITDEQVMTLREMETNPPQRDDALIGAGQSRGSAWHHAQPSSCHSDGMNHELSDDDCDDEDDDDELPPLIERNVIERNVNDCNDDSDGEDGCLPPLLPRELSSPEEKKQEESHVFSCFNSVTAAEFEEACHHLYGGNPSVFLIWDGI